MWRAIWRNNRHREWVRTREKQLSEEYKDVKLNVGWKDIIAMVIAAFQVLLPIFLLVALLIGLCFLFFNFLIK
ncbi:hypothetical protein [Maledivibacter halophilus]|uniref:hypothetical protein n=1 Tax=Maledivibacter halophilus TaxID=36842 RepID=UPI0009A5D607|nr:hypothetical protein [Maledivibacter halophilus]